MPRPTIRLLFDELASPRVAKALYALGLHVHHVGGKDQPPKGSDDAAVLAAAQRTNQTIVTNNHDMIVLCAETGESVIWLDPRDKDLSLAALTVMAFTHIGEWQNMLADATQPVCIVARKTTNTVMPLDTAKRIAISRGRRRSQDRQTPAADVPA